MSDSLARENRELPLEREVDDAGREQERVSQRLRDAREYLGLSQESVAEQLGIPRASVSALETGKRKVSALELKQLAKLYKRPVSYFLAEQEVEEPEDTTVKALFRTTQALNPEDRQQVLRFAQFLRQAGRPPTQASEEPKE